MVTVQLHLFQRPELCTTLAISAQRTTELVLRIKAWQSAGRKVQGMPFIGLGKKNVLQKVLQKVLQWYLPVLQIQDWLLIPVMTSKYNTSKLVTEASVNYALQMTSPSKIKRALYQ